MVAHPYIPNSDMETKKEMLACIGIRDPEQLFANIPDTLRVKTPLNLPNSLSESELKSYVEETLSRNLSCKDLLNFRGGGCWQHYVPAVCDEINSRSEFLTAYTGEAYSDLGRYQALFEFQSMIGELVALDAVIFPLYDWATAVGDAVLMATIATNRNEILVPKTIGPERLAVMKNYCGNTVKIVYVDYAANGQLDLQDLERKTSTNTAAVYIENPSYLGHIETNCKEIARIAHTHGGLLIVGVEPLSLGVLASPGEYGADIVCGECQPLGLHMGFGGVSLGFLACHDQEKFLSATGHRLITIATTERVGEWGFTYVLPERSMFAAREKAASITGTTTAIWAITTAVYLALLGPTGLTELAKSIMQRTQYAMKRISEIRRLTVPVFDSPHFEEFTVNFDGTGKTVAQVNRILLENGILGGNDISHDFPQLGQTALFCINELHRQQDLDKLAITLEEAVK